MRRVIRFFRMEKLTQEAADTLLYKDKRVEIEWNFGEDIFAKGLLILIPFCIFPHEKQLKQFMVYNFIKI